MYSGLLCPFCKNNALSATFNIHHVPYFGEVMESLVECSNCRYKHAEVFSLEKKEPAEYSLEVASEEDMLVRVVRSSHATIEIPELGVRISPGAQGESFISNVEGVLSRLEDILMMDHVRTSAEKLKKADEILKKIERIRKGEERMHLIIRDPTGNSTIISDRARKKILEKSEVDVQ